MKSPKIDFGQIIWKCDISKKKQNRKFSQFESRQSAQSALFSSDLDHVDIFSSFLRCHYLSWRSLTELRPARWHFWRLCDGRRRNLFIRRSRRLWDLRPLSNGNLNHFWTCRSDQLLSAASSALPGQFTQSETVRIKKKQKHNSFSFLRFPRVCARRRTRELIDLRCVWKEASAARMSHSRYKRQIAY